MEDDGSFKIDVINADLPQKCLNIVKSVYQHEQTNKHTRHLIRFEMQKLFGRDTDIVGFLEGEEDL